jgi:chromosome segregation ATPase
VHFLEERLNQLAPEHVEAAFKQNINLKIEVQSRGVELKKYKKLLLELEKELNSAQHGVGGSQARERELEEALADREREIRELRRRRAVGPEDGALREAEARNAELESRQATLEEQLENMKAVMEDNLDEIDHLKDELVRKGNMSTTSDNSETRRARLERKLAEVEDENEAFRVRHEEDTVNIERREEEKEALEDEVERLKLEMEDLERRREAETLERSESRAQVYEEREEREVVEDNLNAVRDQLAATTIELQQREDELEIRCREIDEMGVEHRRQIEAVDNDWRGEVEEHKARADELRDVRALALTFVFVLIVVPKRWSLSEMRSLENSGRKWKS